MSSSSRFATVLAISLMLVTLGGPALAHVTLRVDNPEPAAFAKYTVRVPNESDDAATVRIEVQLPDAFEGARYQPLAGWDIAIDDGVMVIDGGRIEPGEFQEFHFSTRNPEEPGDLVFPSIQVYDGGEEVRWVGEPDSDEPAPVVTIAGTTDEEEQGDEDAVPTDAATDPVVVTEEPSPAPATTEPVDDERAAGEVDPVPAGATSNALAVVALIVAVIGLGLGGAAFARAGKPKA